MRFAVSPRAIYDDMTSSVDRSAKGNEKETRPMPMPLNVNKLSAEIRRATTIGAHHVDACSQIGSR